MPSQNGGNTYFHTIMDVQHILGKFTMFEKIPKDVSENVELNKKSADLFFP